MKNRTLFLSVALLAASICCVNANEITGSCADYLQVHDAYSRQADTIYLVNKATADITVDGVAESVWETAHPRVIDRVASENDGVIIDLDTYPQSEAEGHATFRALWTEDGVYMYITVKDNNVAYQNPAYQWENDAIEFFFALTPGESLKQIIIPAMVGLTSPLKPAALDFESGSKRGSDPEYLVLGYEDSNWDETVFNWAIKKTAVGFDMEVYMDKDIVTRGYSETHYGLDKMFGADVNYDFVRQKQNTSGLYVREGILSMFSNNNNGWRMSDYYGYFKLVEPNGVNIPKEAKFDVNYNAANKELNITSGSLISSVMVYNMAGQVVSTMNNKLSMSVSDLSKGIYMVKAKDQGGNELGVQKVVLY